MSTWSVVRLIMGRELRERIRSRSFMVSTVVSIIILVAVGVVAAIAGGDDDTPSFDVGAAPGRPTAVAEAAVDLVRGEADITVTEVAGRAQAERLLDEGDLDAALVGDAILSGEDLDGTLASVLQASHREQAIGEALEAAGATPDEVAAAAPDPLRTDRVVDDGGEEDRRGFAFLGSLLLYIQLFGFGFWVASGIVEEKASRVVELLLTKAGARPLLAGKVLGIGTIALAQLSLFVAVGVGLASTIDSVGLPPDGLRIAVEVVAWFLLGFGLYACSFAMAGAIASRPEELQNTTGPLTLITVGSFFAATFANGDPGGLVARIATFFPPAAPMVVPLRSAAGTIAWWEIALSAALLVATTLVIVRLAAKVYAGGALFTRGQLKIGDALARAEA